MKFSEIINYWGKIANDNSLEKNKHNPLIKKVAAIDRATVNDISYIEGDKFARFIHNTTASVLILPKNDNLKKEATARGIAWIATEQPRLLFAKAISLFYQPYRPKSGIHPTAIIDPSVELGKDIYIGAYVAIEKGVKIGDNTCLFPHTVIYPDVEIGNNTIIHANCTIEERSKIGANCIIHSGSVIGGEGFGFVPTTEGWYKMEQSGHTVLEDSVEIGCNTCIDRPAVGETRIKKNTKIDNLVQVAHGCIVGQNCALAAQVGLAGGVKIEDGVLLGGQVGVANQITIGSGTIVTAQSGVTHDIKTGMVSGTPAIPSTLYRKAYALFKKLPEIRVTLKEIKKSLNLTDKN